MAVQKISRRGFVVGCSAAVAALAGSRLGRVAFGESAGDFNQETLVVLFLRGGCDGLNVVLPIAGDDRALYEEARPGLQVPISGEKAALPLDANFGLHPAAAPLFALYTAGKLAVVHATGLADSTRSHFDAMQFMESGTPGVKTTSTGWLTRHLQSTTNLPPQIMMPALSAGNSLANSLLGSQEAIAMSDPDSFSFYGNWQYRDAQRTALRHMYTGNTWLHDAGTQTLNALDVVESANPENYTPANGAQYPGGSFGNNLQVIAQMIKIGVGLRVATVDLGGWDTHEQQGNHGGGYFANLLGTLAQGLSAFYTDLDGSGAANFAGRLTVVVMSEFGRRFKENGSGGTDHGHGNVVLVLGGNVNGGQVFGDWPGLRPDQLDNNVDLAITTDYRQILSEILIRRLGNPHLGTVFPEYRQYAPLGIVQGEDLSPIYDSPGNTVLFLPVVRSWE